MIDAGRREYFSFDFDLRSFISFEASVRVLTAVFAALLIVVRLRIRSFVIVSSCNCARRKQLQRCKALANPASGTGMQKQPRMTLARRIMLGLGV